MPVKTDSLHFRACRILYKCDECTYHDSPNPPPGVIMSMANSIILSTISAGLT